MTKHASAKRHAQAIFQIASENNKVQKWRTELVEASVTLSEPQLTAILENPKIHFTDKKELIEKCLPDVDGNILNFVYLLVARGRLSILKQIAGEYERIADDQAGLEHASVVTAIPIKREDEDKLASHLAEMTGKQIILSTEVDPAIIGGFIARIGDKLIDASIRAKLEALKIQLVQQTG